MEKNIIILTSIFACFLMLMTPNINAVQYHTYKTKITEHIEENNTGTLQKLIEIMPTLAKQGSLIDKIITLVLFFVFAISVALTYYLLPNILYASFIILENLQLTTELFVFLASYLSIGISFIPHLLVGWLIKNIGAWDQEILDDILGNISLFVSLVVLMLNLFGFLNWFDYDKHTKRSHI